VKTHSGIAASTGIAIGRVLVYETPDLHIEEHNVPDIRQELVRFDRARDSVRAQLEAFARATEEDGRDEDAAIFEIQSEFLDDPTFGGAIRDTIVDSGINSEAATARVMRELVAEFSEIEDEYFAQRTADIEDLGSRMVRTLQGVNDRSLDGVSEPVIVLARDLSPTDTATMDRSKILGLVTAIGSATSHTAIISRSLGIPAIVGLGELPAADGGVAILDAVNGSFVVDPDEATLADYRERKAHFDTRRNELLAHAHEAVVTTDGRSLEIVANIGSVADARQAIEFGAEGVGLLRTEFLFLERTALPNEEEQFRAYRQVADVFGARPVIVRTLDVGGDKQLPSVEMPKEENPFLGQRAIRLAMADPERLLIPQLRALLRAAYGRGVRIMFPMVATAREVRALRSALDEVSAALTREGVPHPVDIEVGIMVEIPAAAVNARALAPLVDFFSIGTNDLTQYTLAVDRTNERVAAMADYFEPAIISLIRMVIDAAHANDKWVGMCGEMAGDPLALPLLLGLGLDEFSMAPASIPDVKDRLRRLSYGDMRSVAETCLSCESAADVRDILSAVAAAPA
jgi:phosphoenolpyruvate-protein phosphotransferase (PTS system enzyme I)